MMTHLSDSALERLFTRTPDMTLCLHGFRSRAIPTEDGPVVLTTLVAHLVLDGQDEAVEIPEGLFLTVDLPMDPGGLSLVTGHFDDTMDQMTETALERLITEDGDPT